MTPVIVLRNETAMRGVDGLPLGRLFNSRAVDHRLDGFPVDVCARGEFIDGRLEFIDAVN